METISITELLGMTADRDFQYAGKTVKLKIYTQKVTPAYRSQWEESTKDRDTRCQLIADMVASWNITGDDKQMQPIEYDFLWRCPDEFLNKATETIEALLFPNPQNASESATNSPSGSQPTTTQPAE